MTFSRNLILIRQVCMVLSEALANRRWARMHAPFEHVRAENVFVPHFYEKLEAAFTGLLDNGLTDKRQPLHFSRSIPNFDAYVARIPADQSCPLDIFLCREWHDLLAGLFAVKGLGYVNAELHHHPVHSASGSIHTDLNPGWFVQRSEEQKLVVSDNGICNYRTGKTSQIEVPAIRTIRAVAMLFYLANRKWRDGHGGETGLYASKDADVESPPASVVPHNNSLLAFRCAPNSFHSFLSNKRYARNCIVLWVHASYEDAVSQWGERAIIQWPKGASTQ